MKLHVRQPLFAIVLGLADGILTALTLAAGRILNRGEAIGLSLAVRVALAAALSGALIFFLADYSRLRSELARAERQLNIADPGRFATSQLGRQILLEAITGTLISGACSFAGALVPLLTGALVPRYAWLAIAVALLCLATLGTVVGQLVYGHWLRWAGALVFAGAALSLVGMRLDVVG